jgi:hypothetical protein
MPQAPKTRRRWYQFGASAGYHLGMRPIEHVSDLHEANSQARAFIFVWVNWAIHSRHSNIVVQRPVAEWDLNHPAYQAPIYRLDLSEHRGEVWDAVKEWLVQQRVDVGSIIFSGTGSLLWTRSGRVAASVVYAAQHGHRELLELSRAAFEVSAVT